MMRKKRNRYLTAMVWKKRTAKKRRAEVLAMIRRFWPETHDTPEALVIPHAEARDAHLFWLFLLLGDFTDIRGEARR